MSTFSSHSLYLAQCHARGKTDYWFNIKKNWNHGQLHGWMGANRCSVYKYSDFFYYIFIFTIQFSWWFVGLFHVLSHKIFGDVLFIVQSLSFFCVPGEKWMGPYPNKPTATMWSLLLHTQYPYPTANTLTQTHIYIFTSGTSDEIFTCVVFFCLFVCFLHWVRFLVCLPAQRGWK